MCEKFSALKILAQGPKAMAGSRKPGFANIYQAAKLPRVWIPINCRGVRNTCWRIAS
jgi:hypothetical protein